MITVRVDLSSDILLSLSSEEKNPYGSMCIRCFFSRCCCCCCSKFRIQTTASIEKRASLPPRAVSGCGDHHQLTVKRKEKKNSASRDIFFGIHSLFIGCPAEVYCCRIYLICLTMESSKIKGWAARLSAGIQLWTDWKKRSNFA